MALEIVFILDRSGSMYGLQSDVIGGFNGYVQEQQKTGGKKKRLTTILFDDEFEVLHDGVDISEVDPITDKEYFVRGTTALLDAVGKGILKTKKRIREKDKVLFIINTDGYENSSTEFTSEKIKKMVKELEETGKWKFMFLGADIDSFAVGRGMGVSITANFSNTSTGVQSFYETMTTVTNHYASTGTIDEKELENLK